MNPTGNNSTHHCPQAQGRLGLGTRQTVTLALALLTFCTLPLRAANITKAGTGTDLTAGASWSGAVAPGTNDIAVWDTGSLGTGLTLNSGTPGWLGIKVNAGASSAISIGSGGTLTLGNSGIDMSAATVNASISSGLTLGAGHQFWNLKAGSSRTLTVNGAFTRNTGSTLLLTTNAAGGIGTIAFNPPLFNGTVAGAWAIMTNTGTAANNSANGYTFATTNSTGIAAYVGATPETTTASAWGGIASGGSGTVNYDISIGGTPGQTGLGRNVNTLRYTGGGMTQQGNNTGVLLNANAIMNAGTGPFTLAIGGSVFGITPSSTTLNELVLVAANAGININAYIANNVNPGVVTVCGPNTVTLTGANTFTGNLNVNSGTLAAGLGLGDPGTATSQASALGNIGTAVSRSIIVNNGGTLSLTAGNTLGTGASANTLSAITFVVNNGGVFQSGANATGAGWWNKIGNVNLNGGTIKVGSGANNSNFEGLALIGSVNVAGSTASVISNLPSSDAGYNAVHLGQNATTGQSIVFNVADVTGDVNPDLTVATKLINTSANLTPSGLTKTGAGTMTLTAANAFTGDTVISNGVLALSGSGALASTNIVISSGAKLDVSAISYSVPAYQALAGNGSVTGSVTTVSGSFVLPGGIASGTVGTLTFNNNLNLNAGGSAAFDLSTTAGSGNDQVVVGGNLTLSSSDAIHINALSGSLDTADYVLFSVSGTTTMATTPILVWDGTVPGNSANYSLLKTGNNVVLHYSAASAPSVTTVTATPSSAYRNQAVAISASVTQGSGSIVSVTVDASQIGGSASAALVQDSSQLPSLVYTNTLVVGPGITLANKSLTLQATDNTTPTALIGSFILTLPVVADNATWNGGGSDSKWSSNANWQNNAGPGYFADSVTFAGTTQLTPDMNTNYSVTGVTFDGTAGAFVIGSSTSGVLTNSGGITNNSSSVETLNVPVILSAAQTFNTASGSLTLNSNLSLGANALTFTGTGNLTLAGNVSGTGAVNANGSGSLVLSNANTFIGTINISAGSVVLANANAAASNSISFPANSTGTLDIASDSDNVIVTNIAGASGASSSWTFASDRATVGGGITHTVGAVALPQATLNVTAGPNVSGGNPKIITGAMNLSSGVSGNVTINPTTASIGITRMTAASLNKTLTLDGTAAGNEIIGVIDNAGKAIALVKNNSSTWTLSGANAYTNGTTLNAGQLNINNNSALGTGAFTITAGTIDNTSAGDVTLGTIAQNWNGDFTYAGSVHNLSLGTGVVTLNATPQVTVNQNKLTVGGVIAGSGQGITKTGNGVLQLSGANTYSGNTTVNGGKLVSTTSGSSASAITVASGATNGILITSAGGSWTNANSLTQSSDSELDFDFGTFTPSTTTAPMNIGNLSFTATTTVRVVGVTGNFTVGQTYPLATWTSSGPADATSLALIMPTRLTGHLAVSGNTLNLIVDSNTGPLSWNKGNGTWDTTSLNWVDSLNAAAIFVDGGDAVVFDSASGAIGNPTVTLNSVLSPTGVTMNSASHNYTISGSGGIAGIGVLTVQNGTLTLATSNSYTGGTTVTGGALQVSGGTLGAAGGNLTVSGGTADLGGSVQTVGAVLLTGGAIQNGTLTNSSFVASNSAAMTLKVALAGSGGLTKKGNGTLTLTNQNFFTGSVFANAGTLVLDSGSAINDGGNYSSIGQQGTDVATLTLKGNATFTNAADFNLGDLDSATGTLNVQDSASLSIGQFYIGSANAVGSTASGAVNQTGGSVVENNAGIGVFCIGGRTSTNGTGTYNISGGTLTAAAGIRVGSTGTGTMTISGTAVVNANGGFNTARITNSTGTLNLNGGTVTTLNFASSTGFNATNHFNGSYIKPTTNNAAWVSGLTVADIRNGGAIFDTAGFGVTNTQAFLHSTVTGDNAIDGGVTKYGAGVLCLSGTNTYTGNTTVNAGTLEIVQPLIYSGSTVSVAAGAVLQLDFAVTNVVGAFKTNGVAVGSGVYGSANSGGFITGTGYLQIVAVGPTGPVTLTNSISGVNNNLLTFTWPAGQSLRLVCQTNDISVGITNVAGTNGWFTVPGGVDGSNNATIDPAKPSVFYKLVYP
jgi:fibronectin-binding autotransporter adhesin